MDINATPDLLLLIQKKLHIVHYRYGSLSNFQTITSIFRINHDQYMMLCIPFPLNCLTCESFDEQVMQLLKQNMIAIICITTHQHHLNYLLNK